MVNTHRAEGGFSRWAPVCFQATVMDKFVSDKTPADAGGPWGNLCGFVLLVSWPTLMSLMWSAGHVVVTPATSYVKVYKWLICLGENFQSGGSYFGSQKLTLYSRSRWWIHQVLPLPTLFLPAHFWRWPLGTLGTWPESLDTSLNGDLSLSLLGCAPGLSETYASLTKDSCPTGALPRAAFLWTKANEAPRFRKQDPLTEKHRPFCAVWPGA